MADSKILTGAVEKFRNVRSISNIPSVIYDFTDFMAQYITTNELSTEQLIFTLSLALDDLKGERCSFAGGKLPRKLIDEKIPVIMCLKFFPLVIDAIASNEFSQEFRNQFSDIFGEPLPPVV